MIHAFCWFALLLAAMLTPLAESGANLSNDTDGPMLYQAIAEHLMQAHSTSR